MDPARVLVIEDSAADRALLCGMLGAFEEAPNVSTVATVAEAVDAFAHEHYDCALLDFLLPDGDALNVLDALQGFSGPIPPVLIVTTVENRVFEARSLLRGADAFLRKSDLTPARLEKALTQALHPAGCPSLLRPRVASPEAARDAFARERAQLSMVMDEIGIEEATEVVRELSVDLRNRDPKAARAMIPLLEAFREGSDEARLALEELRCLARIGGDPAPSEVFAPEAAIEDAMLDLGVALREADALRIDPMPPVRACRAQISTLFEVLIENSIRYRGSRPPRIHIRGERYGEEVVFTVDDEGLGIPAHERERLFGLFERLERSGDPRGAGVGLTLARRIVGLQHGEIWIEPRERGARIRFTLPSAD